MQAIDSAILEELLLVMGDDLGGLVEAFERDSEQRIGLIRNAASRGDSESVRSVAHTLKGGALGMGANSFAQYCRAIELCGREAALDTIDSELANAARSLRESVVAMRDWLSRQNSQKSDTSSICK